MSLGGEKLGDAEDEEVRDDRSAWYWTLREDLLLSVQGFPRRKHYAFKLV